MPQLLLPGFFTQATEAEALRCLLAMLEQHNATPFGAVDNAFTTTFSFFSHSFSFSPCPEQRIPLSI